MPGRELCYQGVNVRVEYEGSLEGFRQCAVGPDLALACMQVVTGRALPYAIQISPVDSGDYQRSWRPRLGMFHSEHAGPSTIRTRVAALLVNTAPHSALVEWGGSKGGGRRHLAQHICHEVVKHLHDATAVDPRLVD